MFYNKCEFIFVIISDGIYEIDSLKNKLGFGGGPILLDVSFENQFDWIVIYDDFVFDLVTYELCFMSIIYALTPFHDNALSFAD